MHMKGTMEGSCMRIRVNNCTYGSISAIKYQLCKGTKNMENYCFWLSGTRILPTVID